MTSIKTVGDVPLVDRSDTGETWVGRTSDAAVRFTRVTGGWTVDLDHPIRADEGALSALDVTYPTIEDAVEATRGLGMRYVPIPVMKRAS